MNQHDVSIATAGLEVRDLIFVYEDRPLNDATPICCAMVYHSPISGVCHVLNLMAGLSLYLVTGSSMEPTLNDDDVLVVIQPSTVPRRGQIAIVAGRGQHAPAWQVKRIVGLPGEKVSFECGLLFVNGKHHPEPYLTGLPAEVGVGSRSWDINADECIVLGDNRAHSTDSRHFGPVPTTSIAGIAVIRIWPPAWGRPLLLR